VSGAQSVTVSVPEWIGGQDDSKLRMFVETAHHKLAQPLAALRCGLDLLMLSPTTPPGIGNDLEILTAQCDRAVTLMNGVSMILNASPEVGQASLVQLDVELASIVQTLKVEADAAHIDLCSSFEVSTVFTDRLKLNRALWALVDETLRASTPGQQVIVQNSVGHGWVDVMAQGGNLFPGCMMRDLLDPFAVDPRSIACQNKDDHLDSRFMLAAVCQFAVANNGKFLTDETDGNRCRRFFLSLPLLEQNLI